MFELQRRLDLEREEIASAYKLEIDAAKDEKAREVLQAEFELKLARIEKQLPLTSAGEPGWSRVAGRDALTGLPDRVALAGRESDLSSRNIAYVVALLDLDNFKSINDSLGHGKGDELLVEIADAIRKLLPSADIVALGRRRIHCNLSGYVSRCGGYDFGRVRRSIAGKHAGGRAPHGNRQLRSQ